MKFHPILVCRLNAAAAAHQSVVVEPHRKILRACGAGDLI